MELQLFNEVKELETSRGVLHLIGGPINSGKTTLAHYIKNKLCFSKFSIKTCVTIKFDDNVKRQENNEIINNAGIKLSTDIYDVKCMNINGFLNSDFTKYEVIIIDEIHIEIKRNQMEYKPTGDPKEKPKDLVNEVVEYIKDLFVNKQKTVIMVMNDFWSSGEPVEIFHRLMFFATKVKIMRGNCDACGSNNTASTSYYYPATAGLLHTTKEDQMRWFCYCAKCWLEFSDAKIQ